MFITYTDMECKDHVHVCMCNIITTIYIVRVVHAMYIYIYFAGLDVHTCTCMYHTIDISHVYLLA